MGKPVIEHICDEIAGICRDLDTLVRYDKDELSKCDLDVLFSVLHNCFDSVSALKHVTIVNHKGVDVDVSVTDSIIFMGKPTHVRFEDWFNANLETDNAPVGFLEDIETLYDSVKKYGYATIYCPLHQPQRLNEVLLVAKHIAWRLSNE